MHIASKPVNSIEQSIDTFFYSNVFFRENKEVVIGAHDLDDLENGGGQPEIYDIEQIVRVSI